MSNPLRIEALTEDRWRDLIELFGPNGAYGGCWCMWWRETRAEFSRLGNEGNRAALREQLEQGHQIGLLGYESGAVVAWCSVAPREEYPSLLRSPVLRPVDDRPVWSLVCLYVDKEARGRGLALDMLQGAVDYVAAQGGEIVEAYPTIPREGKLPPVSSFMGTPKMYEAVGFVKVSQPSESRAIYRYLIQGS
ncbi:MAG: GNAT family N-acetyltransferase [Anaerolineales bacterium]|nr:GNAT family N-acetyltransferase [Anaerolineales bacterium]